MYLSRSFEETSKLVENFVANDPHQALSEMAKQLEMSEGEVTLALPEKMVKRVAGEHAESILTQLPGWGKVTTIIHSFGSIFEAKAPFPKGKNARGYYNLMGGKEGQLHGHLKLDLVEKIAFVSKPFMGAESYYIGFYDKNGGCIFKVYLGRDKKRQLFPEQVEHFNQLKGTLS
ncbi:heme utilization cystosolic carrier protein HutX [Vibrio hannami]|uniref:heme utilization cystosolic carrier protein HutX n=1 Tax=Vibrio hannami TaxID=2717094 RepID=UPI0024102285|nr:heme utilization cystosolic carrier protein HutX [Vibrio hannami]MDG3087614.1 heme utilization cystosolic carrier protein HutX [Vibrio hannami]